MWHGNVSLRCLQRPGEIHLVGYLEETLDVFPQLLYMYFFDKFTNWFSLRRLQIVITVTVTDNYWSLFVTALHLEVSLPDQKYLSATVLTERLPILNKLTLEAFVFIWIFCDLCAIIGASQSKPQNSVTVCVYMFASLD